MAEPEQQLSSEGCICGSVMGSQYMCRTDRGSILQAERWNVQGGSWSRLQRGLNNEFSLSDRLLCAPPTLHKTWILKDVTGSGVLLLMIQGQHIGEVVQK